VTRRCQRVEAGGRGGIDCIIAISIDGDGDRAGTGRNLVDAIAGDCNRVGARISDNRVVTVATDRDSVVSFPTESDCVVAACPGYGAGPVTGDIYRIRTRSAGYCVGPVTGYCNCIGTGSRRDGVVSIADDRDRIRPLPAVTLLLPLPLIVIFAVARPTTAIL
jgi:hypothetical protein